MLWHLGNAIGGFRVLVRAQDLERAKQVLAAAPASNRLHDSGQATDPGEDDAEESDEVEIADRLARRALRVTAVGTFFGPFVAPYSLLLGIRAWQSCLPTQKSARRR